MNLLPRSQSGCSFVLKTKQGLRTYLSRQLNIKTPPGFQCKSALEFQLLILTTSAGPDRRL